MSCSLAGPISAMLFDFDVNKMAAHDLTVNEAVEAIRQQAIQVAAGGNMNPRGRSRIHGVEEAKDIILKVAPGGRIIYLKDLARLKAEGVEHNAARFNGKPVASLFVYALPQAQPAGIESSRSRNSWRACANAYPPEFPSMWPSISRRIWTGRPVTIKFGST